MNNSNKQSYNSRNAFTNYRKVTCGLDYTQELGGHENRDQAERYFKAKSVDKVETVK